MAKTPSPPMVIEWWPIEKVRPYRLNPRLIGESAISKVADSIRAFGWRQPISVDAKGVVIVGHVRLLAARKLGEDKVPVDVVTHLSKAEVKAYRIADNRTNEESGWDMQLLPLEMGDLQKAGLDMTLTGFDMDQLAELVPPGNGEDAAPGAGLGSLIERFGVAPFSVLDARAGPWQDRKRAWLSLGIESELGRGAPMGGSPEPLSSGWVANHPQARNAIPGGSLMPSASYSKDGKRGDGRGRPIG